METEINDGCDRVREMRFQRLGVKRYKYEYNETKRLLRCGRKKGNVSWQYEVRCREMSAEQEDQAHTGSAVLTPQSASSVDLNVPGWVNSFVHLLLGFAFLTCRDRILTCQSGYL